MNTCKMCGAQVFALISKNKMGVCSRCATKIDLEQEVREKAIIAILQAKPFQTPAEVNAKLVAQGLKIPSSTLYDLFYRLRDQGQVGKSGPRYFVEVPPT